MTRQDYDTKEYLKRYASHHDISEKEAINHAMVCETFRYYVEEKIKEQHKAVLDSTVKPDNSIHEYFEDLYLRSKSDE